MRTHYIEKKINWFQKLNPKVFHRMIRRALYDTYAPIINNIEFGSLHGGKKDAELIQTYGKYKFRITVEKTKYDILLNILTFNKDNPQDCATLYKHRKTAKNSLFGKYELL